MLRVGKGFMVAALVLMLCRLPVTGGTETKIAGEVCGRAGEVLYVRLPQPVSDGTSLDLKIITTEPPIAQARVLSCTGERPFIALAKVERADLSQSVPVGARAYADLRAAEGPDVPNAIAKAKPADGDRFSWQVGAFYPRTPVLRDTVADYWPAYRLNYSFLKLKNFETMLSAEYTRGSGDYQTSTGLVARTKEVLPVTAVARIKPARIGSTSLFVGAGGGIYLMRSEEERAGKSVTERGHEFGHEFSAGLESRHGWIAELRYRNVSNTNIEGYSLTIGERF